MLIRWLALAACVFTLCVTAASAFIRHTQAGLGCQPWPQCQAAAGEARAGSGVLRMSPGPGAPAEPDAVFVARAAHRLSAVIVGLLALAVALFGWSRFGRGDRVAAAFALADTVFLSWLGRYTPHDLPLVTIGNVVGGFVLAAAFGWIAAAGRPAQGGPQRNTGVATLRPAMATRSASRAPGGGAALAWLGLALAALQSVLGVMIGARKAAGACAQVLCLPAGAIDPAVFDPTAAMAAVSIADGQALHLAHRLAALALAAGLLLVLARAHGRTRWAAGPAAWALACALALAPVGIATASGAGGVASGTLHNVLAGALWVLLAVLARRGANVDGIDSH